ncbi:MAG: metallopeptidase family protein [Anaerolineae bacterium]
MWLSQDEFDDLVVDAIEGLPGEIREMLDNVEVMTDDWPSADLLESVGVAPGGTLLGLYEGVPKTSRTSDYGMVLPDRITIFRGPIQASCRTAAEVRAEVRHTVVHELAHHFGIDDDRLVDLGAY